MRYPLWAFFFLLVLPPFTAHALLVGHARLEKTAAADAIQISQSKPHGTQELVTH